MHTCVILIFLVGRNLCIWYNEKVTSDRRKSKGIRKMKRRSKWSIMWRDMRREKYLYGRRKEKKLQSILLITLSVSLGIFALVAGGYTLHERLSNKSGKTTEKNVGSVAKKGDSNKKEPTVTAKNTATAEPTATPQPEKKEASLLFTGDLMVHSYQYKAAYDASTGNYDFSNNFTYVKKYFKKADYVVGNLETTFAGADRGFSDFPRFNTPDSFAKTIKAAGFDLLTTANNHCADKGSAGIQRTISTLKKSGLDQVGTYSSKKASKKIYVKEINGIRVAFVNGTYGVNGLSYDHSYEVKLLNDSFYKDLKKARKKAEFVVALPHNGVEYQQTPAKTYQQQYRKMLEAGADVVIASHPHVLQPMEYQNITDKDGSTRTGLIMYSLGNFLSSQVTKPRDAGVMLQLTLSKVDNGAVTLKQVAAIPTWCRFTDAQGKRNFTVFSVYDILKMSEAKRKSLIRDKDYLRVQQIQEESTNTLLGTAVPVSKKKKKYVFRQVEKNYNRVYKVSGKRK